MTSRRHMRDTILDLLHHRPFQPFRIVMINGDRHDVASADHLAAGLSQINVYLPRSDRFVVLRLAEIASIETAEPAT